MDHQHQQQQRRQRQQPQQLHSNEREEEEDSMDFENEEDSGGASCGSVVAGAAAGDHGNDSTTAATTTAWQQQQQQLRGKLPALGSNYNTTSTCTSRSSLNASFDSSLLSSVKNATNRHPAEDRYGGGGGEDGCQRRHRDGDEEEVEQQQHHHHPPPPSPQRRRGGGQRPLARAAASWDENDRPPAELAPAAAAGLAQQADMTTATNAGGSGSVGNTSFSAEMPPTSGNPQQQQQQGFVLGGGGMTARKPSHLQQQQQQGVAGGVGGRVSTDPSSSSGTPARLLFRPPGSSPSAAGHHRGGGGGPSSHAGGGGGGGGGGGSKKQAIGKLTPAKRQKAPLLFQHHQHHHHHPYHHHNHNHPRRLSPPRRNSGGSSNSGQQQQQQGVGAGNAAEPPDGQEHFRKPSRVSEEFYSSSPWSSNSGAAATTGYAAPTGPAQQHAASANPFANCASGNDGSYRDDDDHDDNETYYDSASFAPPPFTVKKKNAAGRRPKLSLGSHTTTASATTADSTAPLETTADDTLDAESSFCSAAGVNGGGSGGGGEDEEPTPFRFTSFPASLPRIHHPARFGIGVGAAASAFGNTSSAATAAATTAGSSRGGGGEPAFSRTSTIPACPGTVRKRMTFGDQLQQEHQQAGYLNNLFSSRSRDQQQSSSSNNNNNDDNGTHNTSITSNSLLLDDNVVVGQFEDDLYNDDADIDLPDTRSSNNHNGGVGGGTMSRSSSTSSPLPTVGTPVPRAKLNFSSALSSPSVQQYLQDRAPSFGTYGSEKADDDFSMQVDADKVEPRRVTSFAPSASGLPSATTPSRSGAGSSLSLGPGPGTPRDVQLHFQLDTAPCSPIPGIPEEDGDGSSKSTGAFSARNKSSLSSSRDSTTSSDLKRKGPPRPMPDMTAFEGDASGSSRDRSFDDSKCSASRPRPPSPKLLCPPTPVRTPAWAHSDLTGPPMFKGGGLMRNGRSNSLIATKVLATCSPKMLDDRASLENSSLEESNSLDGQHNAQPLMPPLPEKPSPKNHDVVNGSGADAMVDDADDSQRDTAQANNNRREEWLRDARTSAASTVKPRRALPSVEVGPVVSMATHFDVLSTLGRGAFADVYRVRSKVDGRLYAVKRNRRQFRGTRDREKALAEVRCMQRLQNICTTRPGAANVSYSLYLLFFFQAWQEDGHFFCQTELCCRDTCRELMDSLRCHWDHAKSSYPSLRQLPPPPHGDPGSPIMDGRLFPEPAIWKICHDVTAGLCHIHSHGLVHFDIKPSNVFFVPHGRLGALCKIGDFGMAGEVGSSEDGQEGDQKYMAPELLASDQKHPSADIFSFGLTLYELASSLPFALPSEGSLWHELRSGRHTPDIPSCRGSDLLHLIGTMLRPSKDARPSAEAILTIGKVAEAGRSCNQFLRDYLADIDSYDRREEEHQRRLSAMGGLGDDDQTPRHARTRVCSPSMANFMPPAPLLSSPEVAPS